MLLRSSFCSVLIVLCFLVCAVAQADSQVQSSSESRDSVRALDAAAEIDVLGNGVSIINGDATPSLDDHTDFGDVPEAGDFVVVREFTLKNTGTANLSLTGDPMIALSGANVSDFSVTWQPASLLAASESTTFDITFNPSAIGTRTASVSIANTDDDENPFEFAIQGGGKPPLPEIEISGNGVTIDNGDTTPSVENHTTFETLYIGMPGSFSRTYTIQNFGTANLDLNGEPKVAVSGPDAADFTVTAQPASPLASSGSTSFEVTFELVSITAGNKTATLTIANNDDDENPYTFDVEGYAEVTYTVGGTVSGLEGTGMVLQNNAGDDLSIDSNGSFTFSTSLVQNAAYDVTVLTQPNTPGQNCVVTNGSGLVADANVTNIQVNCSTTTSGFTVGGTVAGLEGSGMVLQNNLGDDLAVEANGAFTFPTRLDNSAAYDVTVLAQPNTPDQDCVVSNGSGVISDANVTSVQVNCTPTTRFSVGGTVSGLEGAGLVLQNNLGDDLAVEANGAFTFPTRLDDSEAYDVTVLAQPNTPEQDCVVSNGSGVIPNANVTSVEVNCTTTSGYAVGGTVSGLEGTGLVLQNNLGDDLAVEANGAFTFPTRLDDGAAYDVTVLTQPNSPEQDCVVTNGSGLVPDADVTNIQVECTPTIRFSVGGTVSGLEGVGMVLQNNQGDDLVVEANGAFTFPTRLDDDAAYDVSILIQPVKRGQDCTVSNGKGTISSEDVANVGINCVTPDLIFGGPNGSMEDP